MSHPLKNMMCEHNVPGDHNDSDAMDWAAEKIADYQARIGELEEELTISLRCDECGGLRTLNPSRNFYECLPCHQERMEQQ